MVSRPGNDGILIDSVLAGIMPTKKYGQFYGWVPTRGLTQIGEREISLNKQRADISKMKTYSLKGVKWALVLVIINVAVTKSQAILIDFEQGQGYFVNGGTTGDGNVVGQPSAGTKWMGMGTTPPSTLRVTANAGTSGSDQALVANANGGVGSGSFDTFSPTSADLGGEFSLSSSQVAFSFDYQLTARTSQTGVGSLRIGTTSGNVLILSFWSDGKINLSAGSSNTFAKTANGTTDFQAAAGSYYTISGLIDYTKMTYQLSINGVTQLFNLSADLGFKSTTSSTWTDINLAAINTASANWRSFAIDNFSYAIVPEPSSAALFTLGAIGLSAVLLMRKRVRG